MELSEVVAKSFMLSVLTVVHCFAQDNQKIDVVTGMSILQVAAQQTRANGSMIYSGACNDSPAFPNIHSPGNERHVSTLERFKEIFSADPAIQVTEDSKGKIRIVDKNVSTDLLKVRIKHLPLSLKKSKIKKSDANVFNGLFNSPYMALHVILAAPEVRSFMSAHKLGPLEGDVFEVTGGAGSDRFPLSGQLIRVSGQLDGVSVSEALDFVVGRFSRVQQHPSFWTYETCPSEGNSQRVHFSFF